MLIAQISKFGRPDEVIGLVEQADPGEPGPGEVVIDAEFVPINPADVLNLEGKYGAEPPRLPMNPGAEGVGRIAKAGAGVSHVKVGDRVLFSKYGGTEIKVGGEEVMILRQGDVLAIVGK